MSNNTTYVTLTDQNFADEVLNSDIPVVVDFWAPWCGPCQIMNPIITELAEDFTGVIKVGKINVDDYQQVASLYGINAIPSIIFLHQGREVERISGVVSKVTLNEKIKNLFGEDSLTSDEAA